mmetsp:Transcript_49183/g.119201  ORF Transcript_49183/g.119201 Transcript_49183/m.119201 type:complete len:124 (-) Transcript_49183:26-397(-)
MVIVMALVVWAKGLSPPAVSTDATRHGRCRGCLIGKFADRELRHLFSSLIFGWIFWRQSHQVASIDLPMAENRHSSSPPSSNVASSSSSSINFQVRLTLFQSNHTHRSLFLHSCVCVCVCLRM